MKLTVNQVVLVRETLPLILPCLRGLRGADSKSRGKGVDLWSYISKLIRRLQVSILRRIVCYERVWEWCMV